MSSSNLTDDPRPIDVVEAGNLERFINDIRRALQDDAPVAATEAILANIGSQEIPDWCVVPDGVAEQLLHHEAAFTVYALSGTPGVRFCPHEHTIAVSTLVLDGEETNVWYRELADGSVEAVDRATSAAGDLGHMDSDVVHAVEYRSTDRPLSLHVYHGDLLNADRRMWNVDGSHPRPYNQEDYDRMTVELSLRRTPLRSPSKRSGRGAAPPK